MDTHKAFSEYREQLAAHPEEWVGNFICAFRSTLRTSRGAKDKFLRLTLETLYVCIPGLSQDVLLGRSDQSKLEQLIKKSRNNRLSNEEFGKIVLEPQMLIHLGE